MVCTHAVLEMKKNNRNIPALPIAAAIAVRLAALHSQQQSLHQHQPHQQTQTDGAKEDALSPFFGSSNTNNNNFSNPWEPSSCPALHPMVKKIQTSVQFSKRSIYSEYFKSF
jgi:hypothetical protein